MLRGALQLPGNEFPLLRVENALSCGLFPGNPVVAAPLQLVLVNFGHCTLVLALDVHVSLKVAVNVVGFDVIVGNRDFSSFNGFAQYVERLVEECGVVGVFCLFKFLYFLYACLYAVLHLNAGVVEAQLCAFVLRLGRFHLVSA